VPDQPDQRRAAIQAVRDLLSSRTVRGLALDGISSEDLAAELVDAVHAVAGPFVLAPQISDEEAEEIKQRFREVMASGRITVLPAAPDPRACPACVTQPHHEPEERHVHVTPYGYAIWAPDHDLPLVDTLRAEGYRWAARNARDHEQFAAWWTKATAADPFRTMNADVVADYLEAVGPGTPRSGIAVDEVTLTRAMTAGVDEATFRRESLGEWPEDKETRDVPHL
jgi:hypothetical protein